ncbi:hypothetical protein FA95DRAFT_1581649 [Auriscalpium vulgare]|uniref:Uncharacterized protein n=1 Tax=Auriscalpium vulgare TaxID=40419 RepID=A0ACB8RZX7_9AGAM|nr:hypothetical protein FA95DRAFT_1581649 [Auriscalpium vulgare]
MLALARRLLHARSYAHSAPYPRPSHHCGALDARHDGARVVLAGWLLPHRKVSKALSFFPLRDSHGTTQLVVQLGADVDPKAAHELAALFDVPVESTVLVEGEVRLRPQNQRRPGPAGDIEVQLKSFTLLNPADRNLPFLPSDTQNTANEDLRTQYRYLDLRRSQLSANLRKRSKVAHIVRGVLNEHDFLEVETPILLKSTPEGAREFLVPTRTSASASARLASDHDKPGPLFYALPQSPQQPKQLLMCSGGVDRYYQLARCFRDEDGRKDRQPEFTQIDLEMAFVSWGGAVDGEDPWRIGGHEVRDVVEVLIRRVWSAVENVALPDRFRVMTYNEAMRRFGSDKPDTRFALEIVDLGSVLPPYELTALRNSGETIECLAVRRSQDPEFVDAALACPTESDAERIEITSSNASSWLLNSHLLRALRPEDGSDRGASAVDLLSLQPGDIVWVAKRRDPPQGGSTALGRQRLRLADLAESRGMSREIPTSDPHFLWVTEFPLFTHADHDKDFLAKGRWSSSHHPFTAPAWQDIEALYAGRFSEVRGQHYDLVLNGMEIGGGSVRVHDAAMQDFIFSQVLQLNDREKSSFNHLLHALKCGAPPHGGIALGFDRLMSILCKTTSIRDVIAFPKTSAGTDSLFKSPSPVDAGVLEQYGIQAK